LNILKLKDEWCSKLDDVPFEAFIECGLYEPDWFDCSECKHLIIKEQEIRVFRNYSKRKKDGF